MPWLQLRYDYDATTTYRERLLPFDTIRRKQEMNMSIFRHSRVVVVSWSNRSCDIGFTVVIRLFSILTHINYANQWPHLGHIISCDLNDKRDIIRGHTTLVTQINNMFCCFRTLDSVTNAWLIISYFYSLCGCTNWNITHPCIELVCSAWRAGMRRVSGLPNTTTTDLWSIAALWRDCKERVIFLSKLLVKWQWYCQVCI